MHEKRKLVKPGPELDHELDPDDGDAEVADAETEVHEESQRVGRLSGFAAPGFDGDTGLGLEMREEQPLTRHGHATRGANKTQELTKEQRKQGGRNSRGVSIGETLD